MRAEEDAGNGFPKRICSLSVVLGSDDDVGTAKLSNFGIFQAPDVKCVQKVSLGTYIFIFCSHVIK